eukprot:TRINITY_DN38980_c0_g1_i1.p1 TRINITY_DN38980_c0_g1~~TRINITY_DN38980_c0_g1_i1.p1  ORF type:complete len:321 (-),score=26.79 TRINITY_DN38980_c0_g1_i1:11-913(-)
MPKYQPVLALGPNGSPGEWGEPVQISWDKRDVLLYAVGLGARDLRFVYEGHPGFAVFPTFPIRFGGAGVPLTSDAVPPSPGPLLIDAERYMEMIRPLPVAGSVQVRSRVVGIHPRPKGAGFTEVESVVSDQAGQDCVRMVTGHFRRGVNQLGDIEPFEGLGTTYSKKLDVPHRPADVTCEQWIPDNQAHIYRLSGDYNPLHIDPASANLGGFQEPILHGLCTFGMCAQMLLSELCRSDPSRFRKIKVRFASPVLPNSFLRVRAWRQGPGRVVFQAEVGGKVVVSNAYFEFTEESSPSSKL